MLWIALQAWSEDAQPVPDPGVLRALAWQALAFTPRVALARDAVLMEVSASLRLFGGLRRLLVGLQTGAQELVQPGRLHAAPGPTAQVALGRLRLAQPWKAVARLPPERLPLALLDAATPHLNVLSRLGCRTWGDVRRLPRDGLARRFGQGLLDTLDEAWGERPESHRWLQLPEVFQDTVELPFVVEHSTGLLLALQRLLQRLKAWLVARSLGVLGVRVVWEMDARRGVDRTGELLLRLGEPTQDVAHIARLAAEHLARVQLPAPAQALSLHSLDTVALQAHSHSLLFEDQRRGESLGQLVERLSARLGATQVLRWQGQASHVPERMQQWQPAVMPSPVGGRPSGRVAPANERPLSGADRPEGRAPAGEGALSGANRLGGRAPAAGEPAAWEGAQPPGRSPSALLPTWLLPEPLPLQVQANRPCYEGPLTLLVGPQRLETSGWHGLQPGQGAVRASEPPVMRDYFVARSEQAGLLWIFRERLPRNQAGGWFLHGLFA